MKIALLSDIHGNFIALEACLKYIAENDFDGIAFLGDYITDCPYPQNTIKLIKQAMAQYKTWAVRGNRENYLIDHFYKPDDDWCYGSATGSLLFTYENITPGDIAFFEKMPIFDTIEIEGCPSFSICHGSPKNAKEKLISDAENSRVCLDELKSDYLFCGHSHRPFQYEYNGKYLANCGSVGMPVNGQSKSQFTIIESINNKWIISLVSIPYDISKIVNAFEQSGIYNKGFLWSKALVKELETGENCAGELFKKAVEIAEKNNANYRTEEYCWEQAANELGIY